MSLFDFFKKKEGVSLEEEDVYNGDTPDCPNCGAPLTKRYVYSDMYCENCRYGLDDDSNDIEYESIDVYDAALIWQSNGKDEDYTFGYSVGELEATLK